MRNQPLDLLRHDKSLESKGLMGNYLLKYYARVPHNAFQSSNGKKSLTLEHDFSLVDNVQLAIKTRGNALFNGRYSATITEVELDTTNPHVVDMYIKIHNSGLMTNLFKAMICSKFHNKQARLFLY